MTVTLQLLEADGTDHGTLAGQAISWEEGERVDGRGTVTVELGHALLSELIKPDRIVRCKINGSGVFEWLTRPAQRSLSDQQGGRVTISGPGTKALLGIAKVYAFGGCALNDVRERVLGWQDNNFSTAAKASAHSNGTWRSKPFDTIRPDEFPVDNAELISPAAGARPAGPTLMWSPTFNVTADTDYVLCISADDEYDVYIDGMKVGESRGPWNWTGYEAYPVTLCAGTHRIAARLNNLDRPNAATNIAWLIAALAPAAADGLPAAQNQQWEVDVGGATAGTFTLKLSGWSVTGIAYNASAQDVKDALVNNIGFLDATQIDVTGSGTGADPWVIELTGSLANMPGTLSGDGSSLTGGTLTINETQHGGSAPSIIRTTDAWKVQEAPSGVVGLTPGEVIRILLEEAQARGDTKLDNVTLGFTDANDSDGNAWTSQVEIPVEVDRTSILQVVQQIERLGFDTRMATGLVFDGWNNRGADLTATVTLDKLGAGSSWSADGFLANVLRSDGPDGPVESPNAGSVTAEGRYEEFFELAEMSEEAIQARQEAALDDAEDAYQEASLEVAEEDGPMPYSDYEWGDLVTCADLLDAAVSQRVAGYALRVADRNGALTATTKTVVQ